MTCLLPFDEIFRKSLLIKSPVQLVHNRAHLHGILARGEVFLDDPSGVDESLASRGIDVHCVLVMWNNHLVDWVQGTQLSVRRNDERLHAGMCAQAANYIAVITVISMESQCSGDHSHLIT